MLARAIAQAVDTAYQAVSPIPAPFLGPLFEPGVEPVVATGFDYTPAEVAIHGVPAHGAIDLDVPRGTQILAPADGYYLCTYGETLMRHGNQPRLLSYQQALQGNPPNADIRPPDQTGEWAVYFGSFVVQGWHGRGRYTQFAHIDWAHPRIPYHPPAQLVDARGHTTGDLAHSQILRDPVRTYRRPGVAAFFRAGEVIATVGMTGCGWGQRCYDDPVNRPDFRGAHYYHYTEPHLHFATFGRAPKTRNAKLIDPFGLYGQVSAGYPLSRSMWHHRLPTARHQPLWLPQD